MKRLRISAARRAGRFCAPTSVSVLLHVIFAMQAGLVPPSLPAASPHIEVYVIPVARTAPGSNTLGSQDGPWPRQPRIRTLDGQAVARPHKTSKSRHSQMERQHEETEYDFPAAPPLHDHPPRPVLTNPVELELDALAAGRRGKSSMPSSIGDERESNLAEDPAIAPLLPQGLLEEGPGIGPSAAGGGAGLSFDTWSPPVFAEEMARATEKIARAEAEFQREKNTDLGHGVICSTGNGWFVCADEDIAKCNRNHDDMCRYAKSHEREELERDRLF